MKLLVIGLKKLEMLSGLSMRLTKITGKSNYPIHPKHLIPSGIWFGRYLNKKDVVLDLGSNSGQLSLKIASRVKQVIGLDIDRGLIEIAKREAQKNKIKNVRFLSFDANNKLPFKNNFFDKVICSDVLEHLEKRDFALSEIKRVLKGSGFLLLVTDNPDTSWKRLQKSSGLPYYADPDHKYEYPKKEILTKLEKNRFKIISTQTVTFDTPLKGIIDLVGGVSLKLYKSLRRWREYMVKKHPEDTTGYKIVAQKI